MQSMRKLKPLELFLYGHTMNSQRLGAVAILMLLVIVECDRFYDESVDFLGDRFLIKIRCDRVSH